MRRKVTPMLTDTTVVKSSSGRTDINLAGNCIEYITDKYYGVDRCSEVTSNDPSPTLANST